MDFSLFESNSPQQVVEARIRAQAVEHRIRLYLCQVI